MSDSAPDPVSNRRRGRVTRLDSSSLTFHWIVPAALILLALALVVLVGVVILLVFGLGTL